MIPKQDEIVKSNIYSSFANADEIEKAKRRTYQVGEISPNTGLQKQPDGSWKSPKKGSKSSKREGSDSDDDKASMGDPVPNNKQDFIDSFEDKITDTSEGYKTREDGTEWYFSIEARRGKMYQFATQTTDTDGEPLMDGRKIRVQKSGRPGGSYGGVY